jgi:hypothetical protein
LYTIQKKNGGLLLGVGWSFKGTVVEERKKVLWPFQLVGLPPMNRLAFHNPDKTVTVYLN